MSNILAFERKQENLTKNTALLSTCYLNKYRIYTALVLLDTTSEGVCVPHYAERIEGTNIMVLRFEYNDFSKVRATPDCIEQMLGFSGRNYYCVVPWTAVKMIHMQPK